MLVTATRATVETVIAQCIARSYFRDVNVRWCTDRFGLDYAVLSCIASSGHRIVLKVDQPDTFEWTVLIDGDSIPSDRMGSGIVFTTPESVEDIIALLQRARDLLHALQYTLQLEAKRDAELAAK